MEIDSLLGSQRWKILEIVSARPSSPIEISSKLKTSVAYVSQQLKLLEAAGIVLKERTGFAQKGKPRNVYSVSKEMIHVALLTNGKSEKKSIKVDDYRKMILRTWFLDNESLIFSLENFFWHLREDLEDIDAIYLDRSKSKERLIIFSNSVKVKRKIETLKKSFQFGISLNFSEDSEHSLVGYYLIHDSRSPLNKKSKAVD